MFANLVLGDEINRAPPKTQSALLEAMQERQVTVDGITHLLPSPFAVVATQNPIEYEGTYPLPEAQLDRFLLRVPVGYPDRDAEWDVIRRRAARGREEVDLAQISDARTVLAMRDAVERVEISEPVGRYLVDVVRATRSIAGVEIGCQPSRRTGSAAFHQGPRRSRRDANSYCLTTSRRLRSPVSPTG